MTRELKTYPPTWDGDLLLVCRKCQKKLRGDARYEALAKLKKTVKRLNKTHPDAELHVIGVPCMDLCPKNAVTICLPVTNPNGLSILREEAEVAALYER